jgi:hypothetical protein
MTYFTHTGIVFRVLLCIEGWVAKSVARQLAMAALWVRIQTSLKNHKWATLTKEWPTHFSPPKKYTQKKGIVFAVNKLSSQLNYHGLVLCST